MQELAVSDDVRAHVGSPKNFGDVWTPPTLDGGVVDP